MSRSRSQSPLRSECEEEEEDVSNKELSDKEEDEEEKVLVPRRIRNRQSRVHYQLILNNIPETMSSDDVRAFISSTVNSKHVTDSLVSVVFKKSATAPKYVRVLFSNKEAAEEACEQLKDVEMNGMKLYPKIEPTILKPVPKDRPRRAKALMSYEPKFSTGNVFGLSPHFLRSLGIEKLIPRIFVSNLVPEVDEQKLHEVFGLAGKIVNILLMTNTEGVSKCCATITYDHPVEAVQAISMFHNQTLFGRQMVVHMDGKKKRRVLPIGLESIGPGLGPDGKPMSFIRTQIELNKLKCDIREWMDTMNESLRHPNNFGNISNEMNQNQNLNLANPNAPNPNGPNPNAPDSNQIIQTLLQGILQQGNLLGQNAAQSQPSPKPGNQPWQDKKGSKKICFHCRKPGHIIAQCRFLDQPKKTNETSSAWISDPLQDKLQIGGSNFMSKPSNMSEPSNMLGPSQMTGPNFMPRPNNMSGPNFMPRPNNMSGPNFMPRPNNMPGPNNMFGPNNMSGPNMPAPGVMPRPNMSGPNNMPRNMGMPNNTGMPSQMPTEQPNNDGASTFRNQTGDNSGNDSDMVVFRNLPTSVNVDDLKNKMREVGVVKFAEIMARGKAVVRFESPREAAKCISMFDRSRVDGQVINVHYI